MRAELLRAAARVLAVLVCSPSALFASAAPLANFDRVASFEAGAAAREHLERLRTDADLLRLGSVAHVHDRFGVPTFVWATRAGASAHAATTPRNALQAARAQVAAMAPLWRLENGDIEQLVVRRTHDTGHGGIVVSFGQEIDGVEVFRDRLHVLMNRDLEPIAVSGHLTSRTLSAASPRFDLDAPNAIAAALADFGTAHFAAPSEVHRTGATNGGYEIFEVAGADLRPVRAKRVLFRLPEALEPGWYLELIQPGAAWSYVVSATDGSVLFRNNLTSHAGFTYRVWADAAAPHLPFDGPQGNAPTPHPTGTPSLYAAPFVAPGLVTLLSSNATRDPWLPEGATETVGNNVDASVDLSAPDGLSDGDFRASVTSPGTFDRVYDVEQQPGASTDQQMASITQLFFACNHFHDWYYDAGFDESSGNAQHSNFGRGGLEGDRLLAHAQDYDATNNASMTVPADGATPIIQMFPYVFPNGGRLVVEGGSSIAGYHGAGVASFAPASFTITGDLVLVNDGVGTTSDACEAIVNSVAGKIAVIDQGTCDNSGKAALAQAAGAIGVILVNNNQNSPLQTSVGGSTNVGIGVVSVTYATGLLIKAELAQGPVSVTISRQPQLTRDSALDNAVAAHEFGHLVSGRLIGDANGLTTNQAQSMGEGWADFHALLMMVRPEDALVPGNESFQGVYSLGSYAASRSYAPTSTYYFGMRRYPFSTDFTKYPLTFRHVANGVVLPAGIPVAFGADGQANAAIHRSGDVWCNALWECYAALLRDSGRLGFAEARDRMRRYLIASYKMTPVDATFTEARDALLSVVYANELADHALFCQAFARRGFGSGAVSPTRYSTTHSGVVESFACGGALSFVGASLADDGVSCDRDGYLDDGETGLLRVTIRNFGGTSLTGTSIGVTSTHPGISFPNGNAVASLSSSPFTDVTATFAVSLSNATEVGAATFQIQYDDPGLVVAGPRVATISSYVGVDEIASRVDNIEPSTSAWTASAGLDGVQQTWGRVEIGPTEHRYFAQAPATRADLYLVSPPLDVAPTGNFTFSFNHAYAFHYAFDTAYDGGVLELSNDGGVSWIDIGSFASPGYNGTIRENSGNPLQGRLAYVDRNVRYPALQTVNVNLGTTWAGQTVRLRFRLGTDWGNTVTGWWIDEFSVSNVTNSPFRALIADPDTCALTPTLLTHFEARARFRTIEVAWQFAELSGDVTLERSTTAEGPWSTVDAEHRRAGEGFVALDRDVEPGIAYFYRLVVLGEEGGVFGPVSAIVPLEIAELALERIAPNPSSGDRLVQFTLPRESHARLRVLDPGGREVARLFEGRLPAGPHQSRWRTAGSARLAPGIYFVTLEAGGELRRAKAVVLD